MASPQETEAGDQTAIAFTARRWLRGRGLVGKFAMLFAVAGLLVAAVTFVALQQILAPAFTQIEDQVSDDQQARVRHSLDGFNEDLMKISHDYAHWDDLYNYAQNGGSAFQKEMFNEISFENLGIEALAVIRLDGTIIWSGVRDPRSGKLSADEPRQMIRQVAQGKIARLIRGQDAARSYVLGQHGIYSVQAVWIRKSDVTGQPRAFLVMARLLRQENLSEALQVRTRLKIGVKPQVAKSLLASPQLVRSTVTESEIHTTFGLQGQDKTLIGTIEFATPRTISAVGARSIRAAMLAMGLGLALLMLGLALGVNRISVRRLQSLRRHIGRFHKERQPLDAGLMASGDEIGTLARQFDRLGVELQAAEEELRQQSYVQGKADSAVGLLHNVRNALGPLQVKYDKWQTEDARPFRSQLRLALEELAGSACDEQRRIALEGFAKTATARLVEQSETRAAEIDGIKQSIDQILAILADYDFDSSPEIKLEAVDVGAIIVREIHNLEAAERTTIDLVLPERLPRVWANHLHLTQIVGNLLTNAVESMQAAGSSPMHLHVGCEEANGAVELTFTDNGEGVTPEALVKAFERGFSSREHKSGGMGLHWSGNAARAMQGALVLESEGAGRGATARLTLQGADRAAAAEAIAIAA